MKIEYSEEYDSDYDVEANEWLEKKCSDPNCEFCKNRPERPLEEKTDGSSKTL